jgi:20S proteasome subunit alpha 6
MFRNQYDNDITVWSPQGSIHQIEYAMEAVKQGSAAVGLKSKTHSIVLALKRSSSELASYQKKVFKIDEHVGIAIAGLTSDARVLSNFMRTECLRSRFVYNRPLPVQRLVSSVGDKAQVNTQRYGSRPYGVGLLVVGYDGTGSHLYEFSPSGNCFDYIAMSIGARSQSAKTYLEKNFATFDGASLQELIKHGLFALRDTLQGDTELTSKNCSIGVVGENCPFKILEGEELEPYLALLEGATKRVGPEPKEPEPEPIPTDIEQQQDDQQQQQAQDDQDSPQPFMQTD